MVLRTELIQYFEHSRVLVQDLGQEESGNTVYRQEVALRQTQSRECSNRLPKKFLRTDLSSQSLLNFQWNETADEGFQRKYLASI